MKKIILQHCTIEQQALFDVSKPINEAYAAKNGYEYVTNSVRPVPERSIYWEKIAYLREMLPTFEDGSLVVWEDADSINVSDEDFINALPVGGMLGLVQNRAGLNGKQLISWYNAGVMVMINCKAVRDFFDRVWIRPDETDESAIVGELREHGWVVGDGVLVSSLNPKWNCWKNNCHICPETNVQSWHGVPLSEKLHAMTKFLAVR